MGGSRCESPSPFFVCLCDAAQVRLSLRGLSLRGGVAVCGVAAGRCCCVRSAVCVFSCGGFVIPHERVLGFVIRKKIPIYKSATEQPPVKVKPFRACGFGNPHFDSAGLQIRRSGKGSSSVWPAVCGVAVCVQLCVCSAVGDL